MTVFNLLIELGLFDIVVVCAVLALVFYKTTNRPKKLTKPPDIPKISDDEKKTRLQVEMLKIIRFLKWCNKRLKMNSFGCSNKFFLSCYSNGFEKFIDESMNDFSHHPELHQLRMLKVRNFIQLFVNSQFSKLLNADNLGEQEINEISKGFRVVGLVCKHLHDAFFKFGKAAEISFGLESNDRWKKMKKEIEADFADASDLLKDEYPEAELLNVERIVKSLNADVVHFTGDVLKTSDPLFVF